MTENRETECTENSAGPPAAAAAAAAGTGAALTRVLFVDDEIKVLDGLRRMLRTMRNEWQMTFVEDPLRAVELVAAEEFDAIVVDMRMPQMNGAELLRAAREHRPGMARIVLSGHAEKGASLRSVGLAHQFLAKPCDADRIRATVARACGLRRMLSEAGLADVVCRLGKLPSLPELYRAINDEMSREDASLKRVAEIVSQDIAMTAKVLQLVNSAFFGLGRRVASIEEAVSYLGVDVLRSLVASNAAFAAFETETDYFENLWRHCSLTGAVARSIAREMSDDLEVHGDALQAGLLHDIGALVLAARLPDKHRAVREAQQAGESRTALERNVLGCDHGRIGAYLLGLWGLSDRIVEAIAYHETPSECADQQFSPLTAVHAANHLVHEALGAAAPPLDLDYLEAVGCADRLDAWRAEAQRTAGEGESDE